MRRKPTYKVLSNGIWTLTSLSALLLLMITLRLVIQSDESRRTEVRAYLNSPQPIVVLHEQPELQAGISSFLESGTWVTVLEYNPDQHPRWAYIEQGNYTGWVQIEYLSEHPP